jgi:[ribosomal protein S5]-alanine N-acetyltransferase
MITIRTQKVTDAKRFCEIINSKDFNPKKLSNMPEKITLKKEMSKIKENLKKVKEKKGLFFTILENNGIVGVITIKPNLHDWGAKHMCELGYFIDSKCRKRGITTKAVKLASTIALKKGFRRIEIRTSVKNKASAKVAEKAGFKLEGILKKAHNYFGKIQDNFLYAKVK